MIGVDAMAAPATDTVGATGSRAGTAAGLVAALAALASVVAFAGAARFATVRARR